MEDRDGDGLPEADDTVGIHVNGTAAHVVVDLTGWFPADGLGLVSDFQESTRYSVGDDDVAVVLCYPSSGPYPQPTVDAVTARFADIAGYYRDISGNRYRPTFTVVGQVAQRATSSAGDLDCMNPAQDSNLGGGHEAMVVVRDKPATDAIAYGWAGPGMPSTRRRPRRSRYPANGRDGLLTMNTLVDPTIEPYWFVAAHELGHMLAWPHSFAGPPNGSSQYDNPLDLMSRPPQANYQPRTPQLTLAFNRFAAGWLDPSLVSVHRGNGASYEIGAIGSGAPELLVVPSTEPGAFVTLEVRQGTSWDSGLTTTGVAIHRIDQRNGSCVTAMSQNVGGFGFRRCTDIERRQQQWGPQGVVAKTTSTCSAAGAEMNLGGVTVRITDAGGGRFRVEVSGAAVVVPALNGAPSVFEALPTFASLSAGWSTGEATARSAVVDSVGWTTAGPPQTAGVYCLIGTGTGPWVDKPVT